MPLSIIYLQVFIIMHTFCVHDIKLSVLKGINSMHCFKMVFPHGVWENQWPPINGSDHVIRFSISYPLASLCNIRKEATRGFQILLISIEH